MTEARLVQHARDIFTQSLHDCRVEGAYQRKLQIMTKDGRTLLHVAGETLDLTGVRRVRIVSAGKAANEMLAGFLARVPFASGCEIRGVLIAPQPPEDLPQGIQFFAGGHPVPNQASFEGARAALQMAREAAMLKDTLCLFLMSGGASAMMELPLAPAISLEETAVFYQLLVHSGATIAEINCIRKHFSAIKGGRLGRAAGDAPSLTLLVSDVPPEHLDSLASGPTLPDPTTIGDCRELLSRYGLEERLPSSLRDYFSSSSLEQTPKRGDFVPRVGVLLDSDDLAGSAAHYARALGYPVVVDHHCDDWAYDDAARYLLEQIRLLRGQHERVCLVSAGEVVVPVPGDLQPGVSHVGGRNQHFALYFASLLTASDAGLVVLSAGSDGIDGNSVAAGAVVGTETLPSDGGLHLAREALLQFDSSTFLATRGATLVTGPTGNNLRDLRILLAG